MTTPASTRLEPERIYMIISVENAIDLYSSLKMALMQNIFAFMALYLYDESS